MSRANQALQDYTNDYQHYLTAAIDHLVFMTSVCGNLHTHLVNNNLGAFYDVLRQLTDLEHDLNKLQYVIKLKDFAVYSQWEVTHTTIYRASRPDTDDIADLAQWCYNVLVKLREHMCHFEVLETLECFNEFKECMYQMRQYPPLKLIGQIVEF